MECKEKSLRFGLAPNHWEKGCSGTVEEVIKAFKCREPEKRIPVLRLELDYELALLHEALVENNTHRIDQCKARLKELRREMLMLEAL
jgi:hypothetical protein